MGAGHIVAVMGLKDTTTGDTLCDPQHPVILESMTFPAPVIHVAIEPKTKGDQEKLGARDPAARRGGPDLPGPHRRGDRPDDHRRHGRAPPRHPGRPDAARVQRRGQRRQAAGGLPRDDPSQGREGRLHPQEADRWLRASTPRSRSSRAAGRGRRGRSTSSSTRSPVVASRGSTSRRSTPAARTRCSTASWPATRSWASRRPCSTAQYHDVDSSEMAFKIAGSMAFKEAARKADPVLLEPMMAVEVPTPEDYMGDVIGDLNSPPWPDPGHGGRDGRQGSSRPWCPFRRCSATSATCGRRPRVGRATRCSSTPTPRSRRTSPRRSSRRPAASKSHGRPAVSPTTDQ